MGTCELCGAESNNLFPVKVAGTKMNVCGKCRSMGKDLEQKPNSYSFRHTKKEDKIIEDVVSNYASIINSAISKKQTEHKKLAMMLNIRESLLNKYLTGKLKPDIANAKKLEKFFTVRLIEEKTGSPIKEEAIIKDGEEIGGEGLTMGDLLKNLKR